ncbi:MFS transporter [Sphingomonas immobilis]|uniref:MFS transporter n=1 Tax=Sphingomonas immobilis TaxID=3063997 RepID=A0ABT8ZU58_9SPHN|nr:MFS transporter [Sphingomonas sp. CA1-15]MDO7840798.1 MFS transporter [Sphingomonas sp. CA1-15]
MRKNQAQAIAPADRWTKMQMLFGGLAALAILVDGYDSQLIALCLPAIARDWHIDKSAFAGVLALGTVGVACGAALAGIALDRIGRRLSLIATLSIVAIGSISVSQASNLITFGVARFVVGAGIGGALAAATTCLAEFTPPHRRSAMVSFGILCMPLGGVCASTSCAALLDTFGWRTMFVIGGVGPALLVVVLALVFPETPAFLSGQANRREELERVMARTGAGAWAVDVGAKKAGRAKLSELFNAAYRRDTILIWIALFGTLCTTYLAVSWIPSLFASAHGSFKQSSAALAANGIGAIIGAAATVLIVQWFGTRKPILFIGLTGAAGLLVLSIMFSVGASTPMLFALLAITSVAVGSTQSLLYVVVSQIYPSEMRGTGVGFGMAIGRVGAVSAAFIGGWALHLGGQAFFVIDAAMLLITTVAGFLVGRQALHSKR